MLIATNHYSQEVHHNGGGEDDLVPTLKFLLLPYEDIRRSSEENSQQS